MQRRPSNRLLFMIAILMLAVSCGTATEVAHAGAADATIGAPPPAPTEMESFAFLAGEWDCEGRWRQGTSTARRFRATWRVREALDGHVLLEEYRAFWPDCETFVYGTNFRTFDAANRRWITRWQSALDGTSFELGQPAFSEDSQSRRVVTFVNGDGEALQRAIYRVLAPDRFTWQGDGSEDGGTTWDEAVMVIDCARR